MPPAMPTSSSSIATKEKFRHRPVGQAADGIILARDERWIWLPRSEIKKVTEIGPQHDSVTSSEQLEISCTG
jgi:hypothetical protein